MLTRKEELDQFKRELKSLNYYKKKRDEIADKLLILERILYEPKANLYTNNTSKRTYNMVELLEKEAQLKQQKQLYTHLIQYIGDCLEKIEPLENRYLIMDIYIHNFSFEKKALELHMSARALKYYADQVLLKII